MVRLKILAIILSLALLLCFYPVVPAGAAVGMTPSQGIVGTDVTISDLTSGSSYVIEWDGMKRVLV